MRLVPLFTGTLNTTVRSFGGMEIQEISEEGIQHFFSRTDEVRKKITEIPIDERVEVFEKIGVIWEERLNKNDLKSLRDELTESTGYSERLIEQELKLVRSVFSGDNLKRSLEASFGNLKSLFDFVELGHGEYYRVVPAGPVFIISSGNSLIPPLIPTTLSLLTGNLTLLRPSIANYSGVLEVYKMLNYVDSEAGKLISDALAISYFAHDSPTLKFILTKSKLGVVNFWGGEPARTEVSRLVSENVHHPRLIINGPLTGFVIVDEASADEKIADGLAKNTILYDQQLCSSPTSGVFIGSVEMAKQFANNLTRSLNYYGSLFNLRLSDSQAYLLQSARRIFQIKGAFVYTSNNPYNMWTVVLSKGGSLMDEVVSMVPEFNIYNRRRFIEIVVVEKWEDAVNEVKNLPLRKAFKGVDKVQTVGLAVSENIKDQVVNGLVNSGVYRIVPIEDMYLRSPLEPYDGLHIASSFTYIVYRRDFSSSL